MTLLLALAAATTILTGRAAAPPLLDGQCPAAEWRGAVRTPIGGGVTLLAQEDARAIYLCLELPPSSLGTFDLYLQDRAGALHNLHSSAQVGERTRTDGAWPAWRFGNHRGWFSPPVPFTGYQGSGDQRLARFGEQASREVAILKSRFELATRWRLMIEVRALGADRLGGVTFPADGVPDRPESWAEGRRR